MGRRPGDRGEDVGGVELARRGYVYDSSIYIADAALHLMQTNPDLGMSCYRNSCILRELTGVEHYKIERRIALQDFSVPDTEAFVKMPLEAQ